MNEPKLIKNDKIKFAYYDSITDTIANAPKYSYSWFHEMRHRKQSLKTPLDKWVTNISVYSYYAGITLLIVLLLGDLNFIQVLKNLTYIDFFKLLGIIYTPYLLLITIVEADAYILGTINWVKHKVTEKYINK